MTVRTVDLSGRYEIESVSGTTITLVNPEALNPNWLHGDLDGAGTTGYAQNLTMILGQSDQSVELSGQYEVAAVAADHITLTSPNTVNTDWNKLGGFVGGQTNPLPAHIAVSGLTNWIGPFIVEQLDTAFLVVNVVALQGAYKDDGKKQVERDVQYVIEATPVDQDDNPIGAAQQFNGTVVGSSQTKQIRADTMVCPLAVPGRQSVRAKRVTLADYNFKGQVVDEIKWQDLYGMGAVDQPDFGNVTTVRTRTFATQGALNVKERKLNMKVTRRVPIWTGAGAVFDPPAATVSAADIFTEVCLDPALGNRSVTELDLPSIYAAVADARAYFGDDEAGQFCYTFDNDNTSFEEMAIAIAAATFAVPYRQGSSIRLTFERATDDSTLLFNHRNKTPGSESRSVRFGPLEDNDGIEFEYTDPKDDTPATIYLPADRSARKPRKITAQGIRSFKQAYWLAWRAFNKLIYQNTTVEFEALQEAAALVRNDRILVADNTRASTQDGEVEAQDGLVLTLSQDVDLTDPAGSTIFLQLPDATVEAIPVVAGPLANQAQLSRAPRVALALGEALYARTTYQIVPNLAARASAFLLLDKTAQDNGNYQMQAVNYSGLYYANDTLALWLPFTEDSYLDQSAFRHDGAGSGGAAIVEDADRGKLVHSGVAGAQVAFAAFDPPAGSYTKAAWVKITDAGVAADILWNAGERFRVVGGSLEAGHGGTAVSAPLGTGVWHHAAVVYDEGEGTMDLYVDGRLAASAAAVPGRALAQLTAFHSLVGRADDLRLSSRPMSADDVAEVYRATRS